MARSCGQQLVIKQMSLRREMSLGSGRGSATSCGTPISLSFSFLAGKGSRDARPPKGSWFLSKLHVTRVLSGKQDTRDRSVRSPPGSEPGSCSVCRGRPGEPRTPGGGGEPPKGYGDSSCQRRDLERVTFARPGLHAAWATRRRGPRPAGALRVQRANDVFLGQV